MIGQHVLAGYATGAGGRDALRLALAVVAHTGGRLTVAHVHPPDRPAAAGEALTVLKQAEELLDEAAPGLGADYVAQEARGVGRGLSTLASRTGADLIVIGSPEGGAHGRVAIGAAADNLLHASHEAVMVTPAGYEPPEKLGRLTLSYVRRPQADEAVQRTAQAAVALDVPLRLITLAVGDDEPRGRLRDDLALAIRFAQESSGLPAEQVTAEVAEGDDVADALADVPWPEGELLVLASSEDASAHQVFLGEMALKVLRAASCPVAVLPRGYS
ncbi:universal stress protein [Actinomadura rupiterrae]|uniref:universal stress protein n=1 Tax=Actinomadura rupiterrae TaxID=559627 RepID=UPI0020A2D552|nr:universal stress protein [Actinomadura rupiterrae]MCP2339391.1 nucleotide-binding universal stress UspA family protein [Actinomadura rupiterrae]